MSPGTLQPALILAKGHHRAVSFNGQLHISYCLSVGSLDPENRITTQIDGIVRSIDTVILL